MTTLYREIDALGGVIDPNDAEARGRMEMLDTVLEILTKRGFTEYADAPPTVSSWDAGVTVGKFCEPGLSAMVQAYYAEHFSKATAEQHTEDYIAAYNAMLADLNAKRTRPVVVPELATLEVGL